MQFKSIARKWLATLGVRSAAGVRPPTKGLVYVPANDDGPLTHAKPGIEIRNPSRGGPWIVVDHDVASVKIAKWPGRLWAVEIVDAAAAADQAAAGGPPRSDAGYTRAVGVAVTKELPVSTLFGPYGDVVCEIIETARALTTAQAATLSSARHPDAGIAYDRAFRTWLTNQGLPIYEWEDDFDGTLDARREGSRIGSPILQGLKIVHDQLARRAEFFEGDRAFATDDNGDGWLVKPWSGASSALCDTALALGAPDLVSAANLSILTTAWAAFRR